MLKALVVNLAIAIVLVGCDNRQSAAPTEAVASGAPFEVQLVPQVKLNNQKRAIVYGTTNLPDNTELSVAIAHDVRSSLAGVDVIVKDGEFQTEPIGPVSGFELGTYDVEVLLVANEDQPANVQALLGADGSLLTGSMVQHSDWGLANATFVTHLQVGTSEEIDAVDVTQPISTDRP